MAEYSATFTLTTPGPDITFNDGSGDDYFLDPQQCDGLDMAPVRSTVDDRPQTAGGIVHDAFLGARIVILAGVILNTTGTAANRNTMEDNLRSALEAILTADGTLAWTPSGASARSLTVRCLIPLKTTGAWQKSFQFALVAADPDWA
jgi:hypothetical protein